MKTTSYRSFLQEQLRDPEVKREYDAVDVEFALAREIIALRQQLGAEPEIHLRTKTPSEHA